MVLPVNPNPVFPSAEQCLYRFPDRTVEAAVSILMLSKKANMHQTNLILTYFTNSHSNQPLGLVAPVFITVK